MIYTFYSYKGGVGRSMALANVGELFYQAGLNVLLVDWDLEAPGLERFFAVDVDKMVAHPGVVDMLLDYKHQMTQEWPDETGQFPFKKPSDFTIDLHPDSPKGRLWLLTAGQRDKANFTRYANAVLTFDWKDFYDNWEGEAYFEWLRQQFLEMADVVLVDSRTGITEMGGVCTYQLADVVVAFCTANHQSLHGTADVLQDLMQDKVREARQRPLKVVAVPARVEQSDGELLNRFKRDFLSLFSLVATDTLRITPDQLWELGIPYIPRYAYEETCPVRESEAIAREISKAFKVITLTLSRLADENTRVYNVFPIIKTEQADVIGAVVVGEQIFIGESIWFVEGPDPDTALIADYEAAIYLSNQNAYYRAYQKLVDLRKRVQGSLIPKVDQALQRAQTELAIGTEKRLLEARRVVQERPKDWEAQAESWRAVLDFNPESMEAQESIERINVRVWRAIEAEVEEILYKSESAAKRLHLPELNACLARAEVLGSRVDLPEGLHQQIQNTTDRIRSQRSAVRDQLGIVSTKIVQGDLRAVYSLAREYFEQGVPVIIDAGGYLGPVGAEVPVSEFFHTISREFLAATCVKVDERFRASHAVKRSTPQKALVYLKEAHGWLTDDVWTPDHRQALRPQFEEVEREIDHIYHLLERFEQSQQIVRKARATAISAQDRLSLLMEAREVYPDYPSISEYIENVRDDLASELARSVDDEIAKARQLMLQKQFAEALVTLQEARADALRVIPQPKPDSILAQALENVKEQEAAIISAQQIVERDREHSPVLYEPPSLPSLDALPEPGRLPPGSWMPYDRNALFTGREAELRALAQALLNPTDAAAGALLPQLLQGLGGVGKTQLAVEFAYRYGRFFHGVHWLNAQQPQLLEAEIAACGFVMAPALGLEAWPHELKEQLAFTLHAWATGGPRLIVLDNLEDPLPAQAWLAQLRQTPCRVLITSRRAQWPPHLGLKPLPIACFSVKESRAFLRGHFAAAGVRDADTDGELDALHARLGGLPLGLELAARYLVTRPRLSVSAYLAQLGDAFADPAMVRFREMLGNPTRHALDLAATFSLSWDCIPEGAARALFLLTGFCAPNTPIPYALLERAMGLDEASCDAALHELHTLGLLDAENAIHPLLAEFARHAAAPEGEKSERLAALADALARIACEANKTGLPAVFAPLRAHVEAVALEAERAGVEDAGALWNDLGSHLQDIADLPGARAAFERALRIDEAVFGSDHPNVARDINSLGLVLQDLGDLDCARTAFERALRIDEATYGAEHPSVARDVNNLGMILQNLGDLAGARAAFERALRIGETVYGLEHPNVARVVDNLGSVLQNSGDLAGARAAFERALHIDEAAYGPDHPEVAASFNNLGLVLRDQGDLAGARAALERALAIDEAVYGPDHPNIAIRVNNLGSVLRDLGDLPSAQAAFERALYIWEQVLGSGHPQVATVINNQGGVLHDLGDLAGARAAFERALCIWEQVLGPDHPQVAIGINNLGGVLQDLGDFAGARAAFERALHIFERYLPPEHPSICAIRRVLAERQRMIGFDQREQVVQTTGTVVVGSGSIAITGDGNVVGDANFPPLYPKRDSSND